MKGRVTLLAVLVAVGAVVASSPVRAQNEDAATVSQRAHFDAGLRAYDAEEYATALTEFQAAYAAKPSPLVLSNIGLTLRALGRPVEAIAVLEKMLAEQGGGDAGREITKRTIVELEARVTTVRIRLAAPTKVASARVWVDDFEIDGAKLGEPLRLNPGMHHVRVRAPGFADVSRDISMLAGEHDVPVVVFLVAAAAPEPEPKTDLVFPPSPPRPPEPNFFAFVGGSYGTVYAKAATGAIEPPSVWLTGFSLFARGGYRFSRSWSVEGLGEFGWYSNDAIQTSVLSSAPRVDGKATAYRWIVAPALRVHTQGSVQFFTALSLGLGGYAATADFARTANSWLSGGSVGFVGQFELGFDMKMGDFLGAIAGALDLGGLEVRDKDKNASILETGVRPTLRVGIGRVF